MWAGGVFPFVCPPLFVLFAWFPLHVCWWALAFYLSIIFFCVLIKKKKDTPIEPQKGNKRYRNHGTTIEWMRGCSSFFKLPWIKILDVIVFMWENSELRWNTFNYFVFFCVSWVNCPPCVCVHVVKSKLLGLSLFWVVSTVVRDNYLKVSIW